MSIPTYSVWHPRSLEWVRHHNLALARASAAILADRYRIPVSVCSGGRPIAIIRPSIRRRWWQRLAAWMAHSL